MAIFMQIIAARLGVVTGKDLAQCCADWLPAMDSLAELAMSEVAIAACDPCRSARQRRCHQSSVSYSALLGGDHHRTGRAPPLGLQNFGMRTIESIILVLIGTIGVCFFI